MSSLMCSGQKNSLDSWFWSSREGWIVNINVLFLIIYRVDGRRGTSAVGSYLKNKEQNIEWFIEFQHPMKAFYKTLHIYLAKFSLQIIW